LSISTIKNKITSWLLEESISHTQIPDENLEFVIRVSDFVGTFYMDILKEKQRERLFFIFRIDYTNDESSQKAFLKFSKKTKEEFYYNLRTEFLKLGIDFKTEPINNNDELRIFQLSCPVYIEDMTKSEFMDKFTKIRNGVILISLFMNKQFTTDVSPTQTRPAGMG
jgi:hypothetical protein